MIHTSLSPNTESDDLKKGLAQLLLPWNWWSWKKGESIQEFEQDFRKTLGVSHAYSMQRGRDALYILLKSLGIGRGDEVILQAYTCIVVPNAIQYAGAKPVYADIEEEGFNIDPQSIEQRISPATKAVIIQHTFGEPADIEAIKRICEQKNILLIEDCAHALSANYKGQPVGTFGDAAIWSFGRDKIISSVWGGMITTNSADIAQRVELLSKRFPYPSRYHIFQALLHPLIFTLAKKWYDSSFGKGIIVAAQKLKLIPRVIFSEEKSGKKPVFFPQRMANSMAVLAKHQLYKLERFHRQRINISHLYANALEATPDLILPSSRDHATSACLRYTLRTPFAQLILEQAKAQNIYLGDWYTTVLAPMGCQLKDFQYQAGSCPRAERAAEETVNLPTHIQVSASDVKTISQLIQRLLASK